MTLSISPTHGKSTKWETYINDVIKKRPTPRAALGGLIGKLGPPQTSGFTRFDRATINPLYSELYPTPPPRLSEPLIDAHIWRVSIFTTMSPLVSWRLPGRNGYIIYTDASVDNAGDF